MGSGNAGRRSAGLGSRGDTQAHTHAVGVRASCARLRDMRVICWCYGAHFEREDTK